MKPSRLNEARDRDRRRRRQDLLNPASVNLAVTPVARSVVLFAGPMFCGKTTALLRYAAWFPADRRTCFIPDLDWRSGGRIEAHTKALRTGLPAIRAASSDDIMKSLDGREVDYHRLIVIDEVQFFDKGIIDVVKRILHDPKLVTHSLAMGGLDLDSRGEPFAAMPDLLAIVPIVRKKTAVCTVCAKRAYRTIKLLAGAPPPTFGAIHGTTHGQSVGAPSPVDVGGAEKYEPRCLEHWVPR